MAALPPLSRDAAVETWLHHDPVVPSSAQPGPDRIGFHPSGVSAVVQAFLTAQLGPQDVLLDVGSGTGKVAMLAELVAGACALGTEVQPALHTHAVQRAHQLGLARCRFHHADVLDAALPRCTVVYLYVPFTGAALHTFMRRLHTLAHLQELTVCALGVDLPTAPWLDPVPTDAFWLNVYRTRVPGAAPRVTAPPRWAGAAALRVAEERP